MGRFTEALEMLKKTPADNNEHLQTVCDEVSIADALSVLELGVGYGRFTTAILAGLEGTGGKLVSVDILDYPGTREQLKADNWEFIVADDLEWGPTFRESIDVLMIDTVHSRKHTEKELRLFAPLVKADGVIILHDTVSFPEVQEAINAWYDADEWEADYFENNNGLAVLRRIYSGFKPTPPATHVRILGTGDPNSTSGPSVLMAAILEAVKDHPGFSVIDFVMGQQIAPGEVLWIPLYTHLIALNVAIGAGTPLAIGPNVVFASSQAPGSGPCENTILAHQQYTAIFWLSRWYAALGQRHFRQQTRHVVLDFPLPAAWREIPYARRIDTDALVYVKGGPVEQAIGDAICKAFPSSRLLSYGAYTRQDLLDGAARSRACFYISREDNYPLAAVEIGLMGCPIVSDERSCPVMLHRLTGITVPVRERGCSEPFQWVDSAAADLARAWPEAVALDRGHIRETILRRHDPALAVMRIANAFGV